MKVNNGINLYNAVSTGRTANSPNFRGFWHRIGNANRAAMEYLEKGGFFAEFCLMDMCGMVLPRVYQGFQRNKEELGHLNYQAGMEEFLREFITGPSMFLIPIGAVILAGKLLGRGTQINSKLLTKFSDTFKSLGQKFAKTENAQTQKAFAEGLFNKFFIENAERIKHAAGKAVKPIEDFKESFVNIITNDVGQKMNKAAGGKNLAAFENLVADINAAHFNRECSLAVSADKISTSAGDLYLDARKYMEDVIPSAKLSFDDAVKKGTDITRSVYDSVIDKITQVRQNGRELLCLGGTAALAAFLSIIPKIYQLSKKNPALNGMENNEEAQKC